MDLSQANKKLKTWLAVVSVLALVLVVVLIAVIASTGGRNEPCTLAMAMQATTTEATVTTEPTTTTETQEEPIKISPKQLNDEFEANSVKTALQYEGKKLEITGRFFKVEKNSDVVYVTLAVAYEYSITFIFLDKAEIEKVAELSRDDTVTIVGEYSAAIYNIYMQNCVVK